MASLPLDVAKPFSDLGMDTYCPDDSQDILLIGRTGDGKSAAGNSILGRNVFTTSGGTLSTTRTAHFDWCCFEDKYLKIVDCPGLGDTRLGVKDDVEQFINAVTVAIANNPKGYHVILYVVKFGNRFTRMDDLHVQTLKGLLGDSFIKNHCIILMTFGDCFETDPDVRKTNCSFQTWIKNQNNEYFSKLLKECDQRVVLFNNRTHDLMYKNAQIRKLVDIIVEISKKGKRYTNEDFRKVEVKRQELMTDLRKEQEKQEVINYFGVLISKLKEATDDDEGAVRLLEVNKEIDTLFMSVQKKMLTNKKLANTKDLCVYIRQALQAKQKQIANIIAYHAEQNKKRATLEQKMNEFKVRQKVKPDKSEDAYVSTSTKWNGNEKSKKDHCLEKEIELNDIEIDIREFEKHFQENREKDILEAREKLVQLEKKYIYVKHTEPNRMFENLVQFIAKIVHPFRKFLL